MTSSGRSLVESLAVRFGVASSRAGRCAGRSGWAKSRSCGTITSTLPVAHGPGSLLLQRREVNSQHGALGLCRPD